MLLLYEEVVWLLSDQHNNQTIFDLIYLPVQKDLESKRLVTKLGP